jgi:hypothetical protein
VARHAPALQVITVEDINQENICCLNTALLFFLLAHRRGRLDYCMNSITEAELGAAQSGACLCVCTNARAPAAGCWRKLTAAGCESAVRGVRLRCIVRHTAYNGAALKAERCAGNCRANFRELLGFWRKYYRHRGKDCLSLEYSSRIRFSEWCHIVRVVLEAL